MPSVRREFNLAAATQELSTQWQAPGDVFSVLLLLGAGVINRALAQISGSWPAPVAFSFGWVAYAVEAVGAAVGENRLLPPPDYPCKVINTASGHSRENQSWVIGRVMRDYDYWCHAAVRQKVELLRDQAWQTVKARALEKSGSSADVPRPAQAGLCVSIYRADTAKVGCPGYDFAYYCGFVAILLQFGVASIPLGLFGDWSILLITFGGTVLSLAVSALPQWKKEKWACRLNAKKAVVLTRGNGSQHAILILGEGRGLDLEDLAGGNITLAAFTSRLTRVLITFVAFLWIVLLITASGIKSNTWFLVAVGGIGILQNISVAGSRRYPESFGMPLTYEGVIGTPSVHKTLLELEKAHANAGKCLLETFFPGGLRTDEKEEWAKLGYVL